jgi:hypothetical protein
MSRDHGYSRHDRMYPQGHRPRRLGDGVLEIVSLPSGENDTITPMSTAPHRLTFSLNPDDWFDEAAKFLTVLAWPEWVVDQNRIEDMQDKVGRHPSAHQADLRGARSRKPGRR